MKDVLKASEELNSVIDKTAKELGLNINKGRVHCTDVFYSDIVTPENMYNNHNCLGVEMESFALLHNAEALNKKASVILTASDSLIKKIEMLPEERETKLKDMIVLALESAIKV